MSGTFAAVLPLFGPDEDRRDRTIPTLDDTICYLRWRHPEMIETLDTRMKKQQEMVFEILRVKSINPQDLARLHPLEVDAMKDEILRLCYYILRDIAYIDSLR